MKISRIKRFWVWFWYNDITRFAILVGLPCIPVGLFFYFIGVRDSLKAIIMVTYLFFFIWAMLDNDYSNLRKIGMDEYRNKISGSGDHR